MEASHSPEQVKKQVKTYVAVFVALMALTVITVTISTLHLETGEAITVALIIAAVKASLVAGYFMHLISERKVIYATLGLTGIFFVAMMFLPLSHHFSTIVH